MFVFITLASAWNPWPGSTVIGTRDGPAGQEVLARIPFVGLRWVDEHGTKMREIPDDGACPAAFVGAEVWRAAGRLCATLERYDHDGRLVAAHDGPAVLAIDSGVQHAAVHHADGVDVFTLDGRLHRRYREGAMSGLDRRFGRPSLSVIVEDLDAATFYDHRPAHWEGLLHTVRFVDGRAEWETRPGDPDDDDPDDEPPSLVEPWIQPVGPNDTRTITGTVLCRSAPLAGTTLMMGDQRVLTDADGRFTFRDVPVIARKIRGQTLVTLVAETRDLDVTVACSKVPARRRRCCCGRPRSAPLAHPSRPSPTAWMDGSGPANTAWRDGSPAAVGGSSNPPTRFVYGG